MENQLGLCSTSRQTGKTKKKTKGSPTGEYYFPDELIIAILCRLPAMDVLRYRRVCKKWRDFTSSREFTDLHMRYSIPMFLKGLNRIKLVDRCWEPSEKRTKILKAYHPSRRDNIRFSQNSLVIDQGLDGSTIIYNPIYRDRVNFFPSRNSFRCEPFGIYFHPLQNEYCSLWRMTISVEPFMARYMILNLESNPIWREIRNPGIQNNRIFQISPVLIDTYLYWIIEPSQYFKQECNYNGTTFSSDIMRFDIIKEEFRMIPCPVPITLCRQTYDVNLVNIDGRVSLVKVLPRNESSGINVWIFNDDWDHSSVCSTYIISPDVYPRTGVPVPVAYWNGELAIQSNGRLFVCNLVLGTYRNVGSRNHYKPHSVSLVSLKNWRTKSNQQDEEIQTPNQV